MEVIKSKIMRIDGLSLPSIEFDAFEASGTLGEVSFEEVAEDTKLKNKLKSNAYTLLTYLERIFHSHFHDEKILIILDQLDETWLASEIQEYSKY